MVGGILDKVGLLSRRWSDRFLASVPEPQSAAISVGDDRLLDGAPSAIRDALKVLGSNLAVNLSSFVILAVAARTMSIGAFAELSLTVAASQLGASVLDLGTNFSTVKRHAEAKDRRYLSSLVWIKLAVTAVSLAGALIAYLDHVPTRWIVVLVCAASINLWSGTRALEQATQDFGALARASSVFAALRAVLGALGIATGNAAAAALAFFAAPMLAVAATEGRKICAIIEPVDAGAIRSVFRYALPAYLSSVFYNGFLYYPQFAIAHLHDAQAVGMFGVILTFLGPLALFNSSVRLYLLPRVAANEIRRAEVLANPRLMALVGATVVAGVGFIALFAVAAEAAYGPKFAGLFWPLWVYVSFYFATAITGFFNIDIHRLGGAILEAAVNAGRLLVVVVLIALLGTSFMSIVAVAAVIMLLGECVTFALTSRLARNVERTSADRRAQFAAAPVPTVGARPSAAPADDCAGPRPRLRFAVLLLDRSLSHWQARVVDALVADGHDCVQQVSLGVSNTQRPTGADTGSGSERAITCSVHRGSEGRLIFDETDVERLRALDLDFMLGLGFERCAGPILTAARHGVWVFAGLANEREAGAAYWPLFRGEAETTALLLRLGSEAGTDVILKSGTLRSRRTCRSNFRSVVAAVVDWPLAVANTRASGGSEPGESLSEARWRSIVRRPSMVERVRMAARSVGRFAQRVFEFALCFDVWRIGYANVDIGHVVVHGLPETIDWAPNPRFGTFEADPMAIVGSASQIVYERFSYWTGKGDLWARRYDGATGWAAPARRFLEEPFHLSYPASWAIDGVAVCIPESAEAGSTYLYPLGADGNPTGARAEFAPFAVADPTLVEHEGRWYMFGALAAEAQHTLRIWYADTPRGPWRPHAANPVKCDVHTARPAGPMFRVSGQLYRPSQSSSLSYGSSANLMEIEELSPTRFREVTARKLAPDPLWPCRDGIHTLSPLGNGLLIDAKSIRVSPLALFVRTANALQLRRRRHRLAKSAQHAKPEDQ